MQDHGGNLDWAMARWGGTSDDWVDLSTGINPVAYPVAPVSARAWSRLPTIADHQELVDVARQAYRTEVAILPVAGAQAGIQMVPRLAQPGVAAVLGPTYNEHAASFETAGWTVRTVAAIEDLAGADAAVVVNPNNPDGQVWQPDRLHSLACNVGLLVVDESFADPIPGVSLASELPGNALVLRSFGKFFGLAGVRLGFVLSSTEMVAQLAAMAGPWPVSGAAIEIGRAALTDSDWSAAAVSRLAEDSAWLDQLAVSNGWNVRGGTTLFRLYETPDAARAQEQLAKARVWSRIFPYSPNWVRLGLPAPNDRAHVAEAIASLAS